MKRARRKSRQPLEAKGRMGVGSLAGGGLPQPGQEFRIGSFDTEVDREVPYEE
jgi:hypothetical protein